MQDEIQAISQIQKTQRRVAITIGIIMGVTMSIYFFTFAMLIDRGLTVVLWTEAVTTILFIAAYIFLNRISFRLTRLVYVGREPHRTLCQRMKPSDINTSPETLMQTINQSI